MEISGRIIVALDPVGGVSKAGKEWKKREYVLETQDTYPRKVAFNFFGDRVDQYPLALGDDITLTFDIESREFNGRWYTDIRGIRADKIGAAAPSAAPAAAPFGAYPGAPAPMPPADIAGEPTDDLPF